ncbi:MAG: DNA methyltransferase, partial [Ignavibacteriae bacterium]|nr:DNA methyltransferase [Ignavibacteriota bacterium]
RQMRKHLLETFDEIYILDLHGNSKKKETAPDGSKDENVFDIMQGVSISIMIKKNVGDENLSSQNKQEDPKFATTTKKLATVKFAELYGKRADKFEKLNSSEINTIEWKELEISDPNYFFTFKDFRDKNSYEKSFKLEELFTSYTSGIKTHRDSFVMDFEQNVLENRIANFIDFTKTDDEIKNLYNLKVTSTFKIKEARNLTANEDLQRNIKTITYRPFDERWIYYSSNLIDRDRKEIMVNMFKDNVALITKRGIDVNGLVSITKNIFEIRFFSNPGSQGSDYGFPLYLYSKDGTKVPNLNQEILSQIEKTTGITEPEEILDYIYAVLHSPTYFNKFKEFLKIDFPRVPYPKDQNTFQELVKFGTELRQIHLLESPKVNQFITSFPKMGSDIVEKPKFVLNVLDAKFASTKGDVWINDEQYFGNVPEVAWNFYIGGYQPAQKWLKDQKGRTLTNEEIEHYQKIIVALTETDRIMKEIDKIKFV